MDDLHFAASSDAKTGTAAAQWTVILGTGRLRFYATAAFPTGLYRVNNPQGVLSLNFGVLTRLALITGDTSYMSRASTQAVTFGIEANRVVNGSATFLAGFEYLANSLIILVVGHKGNHRTQDLLRAFWGRPAPNALVVQIEPGDALPQGHPATGKGMVGGQSTAYIVQLGNVSEGITDPAMLAYALTLPVQMRQQQQPQGR